MDSQRVLLKAVLAEVATPVFLAGFQSGGSRLVLHVPAGSDLVHLKSLAQSVIDKTRHPVSVLVRAHKLQKLAFPRSLEHWLNRFDVREVMHDPTLIVARARRLVRAAKSCRSELGDAIDGLFFDPDRRMMFVLSSRKSDAAVSIARARIIKILDDAWGRAEMRTENRVADELHVDVRVVTDLPRRRLVPVDARSASVIRTMGRAIRRWLAPGAIAIAVTTIAVPAAAHSNATNQGHDRVSAAGPNVRAAGEFGILFGLAVFADGQRQNEPDAFASSGLQQYFGEIRLAQQQKQKQKRREQEEVGQVGS